MGNVITGNTPPTADEENYANGTRLWASPTDLGATKYIVSTQTMLSNKGFEKTRSFPANSILVTCIGSTIGKMGMSKTEMASNQQINTIVPVQHDANFVYYAIQSRFPRYLSSIAVQAVPILSKSSFEKLTNYTTSEKEQIKIGNLLSLIDERIDTQKKIIEKYESLIRGLVIDVNNGKIGQCKRVFLRDILTECHEKNTGNYEVCSVSVSHGVINQVDYLGRSYTAKEVLHYNVVTHGDIVYTKSPTGDFPYGIVKRSQLENPVAVSPLYGVYRPVNECVGKYLHFYFKSPINTKNYLHKLIQKGAKNTINITNQHFLDNQILIPESNWLESIVNCASVFEQNIEIENNLLRLLTQQKNHLLSKMFI